MLEEGIGVVMASVWMGDPHHSSPVLRQLCGSSPFFLPFFTSISSMPCCCRLVVSGIGVHDQKMGSDRNIIICRVYIYILYR
jgi:hypothetical protein